MSMEKMRAGESIFIRDLGKIPVDKTRILFDLKEMKIGCVLLQAAMGGDPNVAKVVDTRHWFVGPTENMKIYEITADQIRQLIEKMESVR